MTVLLDLFTPVTPRIICTVRMICDGERGHALMGVVEGENDGEDESDELKQHTFESSPLHRRYSILL